MLQQHHSVEPILRLGHAGIVREWVQKGEIEFGIVLAKEEDFPAFNTELILQGTHGLYKAKKECLDRLIISEDTREDHILLIHLKKKMKTLPPLIEVLSWEVIARMIEGGLGMGILPDYVAQRYHFQPVDIPLPTVTYKIIAIWSRKKALSRNARMFIDLMHAK